MAIVGSGITGLAAASYLHSQSTNGRHLHLSLFEQADHIGGHAYTQYVDSIAVDTGFMVCNAVTYPNMLSWFDRHDVQLETSDMSLSVSMHDGALEWSSNGLTGLYAQKRNLLNPYFAGMVRDIVRFKGDVLQFLAAEEKKLDVDNGGEVSDELAGMTLAGFIDRMRYGRYFIDYYLLPVCSSVWSCPTATALQFPAYFILTFLRNHHLLQLTNRPQWLTVAGRSQHGYVQKVIAPFKQHIHTHTTVKQLKRHTDGTVTLTLLDGSTGATERKETFDHVVLACHAPQALELLGGDATADERRLLSAFETQSNEVVLHQDASFLPRRTACHASWNFLGSSSSSSSASPSNSSISLTYHLNKLQNLPATSKPILVTLNPLHAVDPKLHVSTTHMSHPVPSVQSYRAMRDMAAIQGCGGSIWYGGAWLGFGFHEDGFKAGEAAACGVWDAVVRRESAAGLVGMMVGEKVDGLNGKRREATNGEKRQNGYTCKPSEDYDQLGSDFTTNNASPTASTAATANTSINGNNSTLASPPAPSSVAAHTSAVPFSSFPGGYTPLPNPPSFHERYPLLSLTTPARLVTLTFLRSFVQQGHVVLREDGGSIECFGPKPGSSASTTALCATLYVHSPSFYTHIAYRADLGLADAYIDGSVSSSQLLQFLQILILNRDINQRANNGRLSLPHLASSLLTTTAAYLTHTFLRHNSVHQSRTNIAAHYDTGNDFFQLFLDPSMSYSCALWRGVDGETLDDAQLNKWDRLIQLANIKPGMRVLEIGCGWGAFSRRIAQRTGCHVTAITLSIEQLRWCEQKAADDQLTHLCHYQLVDYRVYGTQQPVQPFDRIVSCEMLEAVGHEYLPQFFHHCNRLLAVDGLLVTQVITFPDGKYDEYRKNVDFIREQIFPGGLCPSLTALADAMVSSGSGFTMESMDNIGPHYVKTLGCWRHNLRTASRDTKAALRLTDEVLRKWDYYFVYCQTGFLMRCLGVLHIVFTRTGNNASLDNGRVWWP